MKRRAGKLPAALEAVQRETETQLQQAQAANAAEMETLRQQARKKAGSCGRGDFGSVDLIGRSFTRNK